MKVSPATNGGRLLKRGRTFDPECSLTIHRLRVGTGILAGLGIKPEWPEHDAKCICHPDNRFNRCFGHSYFCDNGCKVGTDPSPTWPEWVEGNVFDLAYTLACETQSQRGAWHQHQINEARREKVLA